MNKFKRERISLGDINEYFIDEINSFTQINLSDILVINPNQPSFGEILKVKATPEIISSKIIKTATGISLEGQKLTGWKYLIEGSCTIRVDYFDNEKGGLVYTFKNTIPFTTCITLPEDATFNSRILDTIHLEDIYYEILSEHELIVNISYLFIVEEY